jgi:hypothetical protein
MPPNLFKDHNVMYTLTLVVFSCSLTWNSLKAFLVTRST